MSFPTETDFSVGLEDGSVFYLGRVPGVAVLEVPVEWMRFCEVCNCEQRFVADMECPIGLVGRCSNCWDVRIAPYTRTVGEAS